MDYNALFGLLSFSVINAFTPGPGNLLALNASVRFGWRRGRQLFLGIFAGYYVVQGICEAVTYGIGQYFSSAMVFLQYAGALYIIWLAVHIAVSVPDCTDAEKRPSFWTGFLLQLVNVKIYMFGMTALTGYVVPFYTSFSVLLLFEMGIASLGVIATLFWAFAGLAMQRVYRKYYRAINILLALMLLQCAVSLFRL